MTISLKEWLVYLGLPSQITISGAVFIGMLTLYRFTARPLQLLDTAAIAWSAGVAVWLAIFIYLSLIKQKMQVGSMIVGLILLYPAQILVAIAMTVYWFSYFRLGESSSVAALIFFLFSLLDLAVRTAGVEFSNI